MEISEFKFNTNIDSSLIDAVIKQFGGKELFEESASDVTYNGMDSSFSGFIYHTDTVKFAEDNKDIIMEMAEEQAYRANFGTIAVMAIQGFNLEEIEKAIHNKSEDFPQILYALALYAAERVCRAYTDLNEYADFKKA